MHGKVVALICRQLIHLFDPLEDATEGPPVITLAFYNDSKGLHLHDLPADNAGNDCVESVPVTKQIPTVSASAPDSNDPLTHGWTGDQPCLSIFACLR